MFRSSLRRAGNRAGKWLERLKALGWQPRSAFPFFDIMRVCGRGERGQRRHCLYEFV